MLQHKLLGAESKANSAHTVSG